MPPLSAEKDHALAARVVKLMFETTFCDPDDPGDAAMLKMHNPEEGRYFLPMDKSLKSPTFKLAHYCALFQYLTDSCDSLDLYLPPCTRDAAMAYLESEDDFLAWFVDNYERCDAVERDSTFKYFVRTKDIFTNFTANSTFWANATRAEKGRFNLKRFETDLRSNAALRDSFREHKKEKRVAWYNEQEGKWERTNDYNGSKGVVGWRPIFERNGCERMDYSDEAQQRYWAEAEVMEHRKERQRQSDDAYKRHTAGLANEIPISKPWGEMSPFEQHMARNAS